MGNPVQHFETYLAALRKTPLDQKTEHTDRAPLQTLLERLAPPGINIQHEPKHAGDKGSPDYKITQSASILGYIEVKTIGANLLEVVKSKQIDKYKSLSKNILLTDYLHFIWLNPDATQTATLIHPIDLANPKHKLNPDRAAETAALIAKFFSTAPAKLTRAQDLALALATRAHLLREGLLTELARQEKDHQQGRLYGLLGAFRTQVFHDLTLADFADAFAQMLAYGLFLARLNTTEIISLKNAPDFIPAAFPLIRELVNFLSELDNPDYREIRWIIEEILFIMNNLDLAEIRADLSFSHRKSRMTKVRAGSEEEHRLFERDPFIYFYEDFLAKYDKNLRKSRGVYYTPPPVVNFIIRAIDDILKTEFLIPTGLADHNRVTMLDFATGTGTFILEAFEQMFETIGDSPAKRDLLIRDHMLKNIFGFEYLIAPYTIAHLKLSQYLEEKKYKFRDRERLQVYLTNTLEPIAVQSNFLLPALSAEAGAAQEIKEKKILVITGNPPYSGESKNKGAWITKQINAYKIVDGKPLGEKNSKWLSDDYVKFIRFAQHKIDQVPEGIVGVITNHSFLDNPTFRGMRQSLMASFDKIYVMDLHGNAKKKEKSPDGSKDENVFDIEQGVAISLFIKSKKPTLREVFHSDLWGTRLPKYESCARLSFANSTRHTVGRKSEASSASEQAAPAGFVTWQKIKPKNPFYLFSSFESDFELEYYQGQTLPQIFPVNSIGIITARDDLTIQFSRNSILTIVTDLVNRDVEDARERYKLGHDVRDWRVSWAQDDIRQSGQDENNARQILYRPFDKRWTYYTGKTRGLICMPRGEVMSHMLNDNIALSTIRKIDTAGHWEHVLAMDSLTTGHTVSMKEINYVFPLFLYPPKNLPPLRTNQSLFEDEAANRAGLHKENISPTFRTSLVHSFGAPQFTPEQIFGYIYAILHAPTYRTRYAEFLRGDFPRIPLCEFREHFEALATLGWDLAQKHLLKSIPKNPVKFLGPKNPGPVEKPVYNPTTQTLHINPQNYFSPDRAPWRGVGLVTSSRSPAGLAGFIRLPRRAA